MEVGDATESGDPALFDKLNIFWHPKERPPLRSIYHDLIQLRKQYAALRTARVDWLHNSDETRLVTFLRADDKDRIAGRHQFFQPPAHRQGGFERRGRFYAGENFRPENSDVKSAARNPSERI